mmetsp:Transcript_28740/g.89568  ORF Transcript_28740/g.89568 Transcript_28740/m.89568 type:complete len:207 (-) Transcript_28740:28-648(-)
MFADNVRPSSGSLDPSKSNLRASANSGPDKPPTSQKIACLVSRSARCAASPTTALNDVCVLSAILRAAVPVDARSSSAWTAAVAAAPTFWAPWQTADARIASARSPNAARLPAARQRPPGASFSASAPPPGSARAALGARSSSSTRREQDSSGEPKCNSLTTIASVGGATACAGAGERACCKALGSDATPSITCARSWSCGSRAAA